MMNDIKSGKIFGEYEVQGKLGKGGMGNVYKALDVSFKRFIALKITDALESVSADDILRFEAEAHAMKNLEHQNITPVYKYGVIEDRQYIGMKFVEGKSLAEILNKGKVKLPLVIDYAKQIARALLCAHAAGIVHRDVKPSNIMVQTDNHIYLGDFGISFALNQNRLTKAGMAMGTPEYMSPEQCQGLSIDARTDIYAFGVILYELLFNRPPYSGDKPLAIAYKHVHKKIELPVESQQFPIELIEMIKKCLNKKMSDRYPSMAEILDELDQVNLQSPTPSSVTAQIRKKSTQQNQKLKVPRSLFSGVVLLISLLALIISIGGNVFLFLDSKKLKLPIIEEGFVYEPRSNDSIALNQIESLLWEQKSKNKYRTYKISFTNEILLNGISMQWSTLSKKEKNPGMIIIKSNHGEKRKISLYQGNQTQYYHFQPMVINSIEMMISDREVNTKDPFELFNLKFLGYEL